MEYVLTRNRKSPLNPSINISQYLTKDVVSCIVLVIHLEIDISEKLNLNLGYILTRASDLDNQTMHYTKRFLLNLWIHYGAIIL